MKWSVHQPKRPGLPLVVNCQSDLLDQLPTRLVIPLERVEAVERPIRRLNPRVEVGGTAYYVMVDLMASVPARSLGPVIGSLEGDGTAISNAIDILFIGV